MKRISVAGAVAGAMLACSAASQTITTQQDYMASDKAEIQALGTEANGNVYSLPHDKLIRLATLMLKYFIRDNFNDPDSVQAIITDDPHHVDLRVWQGILNGGHATYSGMALCARINGKNQLGGYIGDKQYLVVFMEGGKYRYFSSPYYNQFTHTTEVDTTVTSTCAK